MPYYLGADLGATKTHALIADETGRALGFGRGGPGNHETVGYDGMLASLRAATDEALRTAGLNRSQISGAGYGVAGYDFPSERTPTLNIIQQLGISAPTEAVNDTVLGLLAGCREGWGIAVVAGTGSNCRGWNKDRSRTGMVTGGGSALGEYAGSTDIAARAVQAVSHQWTRRGPATALTPALLERTGAPDALALLEGLITHQIEIDGSIAPLVAQIAAQGDVVARDIIEWAGRELGELVNCVVRQLEFEALTFDVALVGSTFKIGPMLIDPMRDTIHALAPGATLVPLSAPPVCGAVLLGMDAAGVDSNPARERLFETARAIIA